MNKVVRYSFMLNNAAAVMNDSDYGFHNCVSHQLQTLIQETDPGADYRIDRALNEACESVIQTACKHIRNGDPM